MLVPPTPAPTRRLPPPLLAGMAGGAVLLARHWLVGGLDQRGPALVSMFVTLGVVGAWWPLPSTDRPASARIAARVTALGVAAFAVGRLVGGGTSPAPGLLGYAVLNTLAAVAEEAFFRRLVYGSLARFGPQVAVVGSAAAFAVVHVTVWGLWVLPLDLAAGLLLSWQRWASGRWSVPAATHVFANLVAVLG